METKKRVLIVDDEPQIGKIFSLQLKLAGYDAAHTTSGFEAVELARTQKYDIMLLDIVIADLSGLEVLGKVREFSKIPIILFTARADIFEMAKKYGANDFIAKPLNPDLLLQKIKAALGEKDQT